MISKSENLWISLPRNTRTFETNAAFMVINHDEEKKAKARMVINYKNFNDNIIFDGCYIPNKTFLFIIIQEPLSFQRWIVKPDIGKSNWMKKALL